MSRLVSEKHCNDCSAKSLGNKKTNMADGDGKFYNVQPKWMATDQIDGVLEYLKAVESSVFT